MDRPKPTFRSTVYQYCFGIIAGMAGMTCGAWLAWPVSAIKPYKEGSQGFKVKTSEISTLVALMDFGNVLSPIPSSYAMDAIGRKLTLFTTAVLYIASSVCALVAYNVYWLYFARIFAGLAKGIAFAVIPIYLGEVASIEIRGALSTMFGGFINIGGFYGYAIGPFVELRTLDLANLAIPLVFTAGFWLFSESPYYLLMQGKEQSAKKSLAAYRQIKQNDTPSNALLDKEFKTMQFCVERDMKEKARFIDLFLTNSRRRALLIISVLALFQRCSGISPTMAYSTEIMPKEGGGATSNVYMIIFSFMLVVGNYLPLPLIDRWGRKPLLIVSSITTGLTTLTTSVYYYLERETDVDVTNIQWIPYACLIIFPITYSIGFGVVPYTLVGELFPTNVKSYASSISAIILAATSFSVNKVFYDVAIFYGPYYMYWFFTLACFSCVIFTQCLVFETKVGMAGMTSGAWLGWPAIAIKPYKEGTQGFTVEISEISTLVALMDFGNVLSPIPSSYAMDAIGRKLTLFTTAVLYIASSVCALIAYNVYWLYFARIFAGLAKGIAFAVIPIYLGEVASIEIRGALSTMFIGFLNIGLFYDYVIGSCVELRILDIAILVIPLVFIVPFFFFPESPYYLLMKGKKQSARKSLAAYRQLNSKNSLLENELETMQTAVENDMKNKGRFIDLFLTPSSRRALLIISALALFQRCSGISPTLAYSTEIMPKEGGGATSNVYLIIFSFLLIFANYSTMPLIDRWGRKPLLIVSSITTGLSTLINSVYYYLERETDVDVTNIQWIPYAFLIVFPITYSIGIGFIPSTLVGELFPTNVKSYAGSVSAIILAATSFGVNKIFYGVSMYYGPHYMYWFFTIACFACVIFVHFFVFETKGKNFIEIQDILKKTVNKKR